MSDPNETTLGNYRLLAELGRGGMANVYLAIASAERSASKLVVLKKPREEFLGDADFITMFVDEGRIAARLDHPNLVKTLDIGDADGVCFLVMEYLEGQTLHRILSRGRATFPLDMHISVLIDVLAGIDHAHNLTDASGAPLHIVHRDVTPDNCFVTYGGQGKVIDFGIARASGRATKTKKGMLKGKASYVAPEQLLGRDLDRRVDIFAVGVMLYEAAIRRRMWLGVEEIDVLRSIALGKVPSSPKAIDPTVDDELDRICRRALAYSADDRYQTAAEFQQELEAYAASRGRPKRSEIGGYVGEVFAQKRQELAAFIQSNFGDAPNALSSVPKVPISSASSISAPGSGSIPRASVEPSTTLVTSLRGVARLATTSIHAETVVEVTDRQKRLFGLVDARDRVRFFASIELVCGVSLENIDPNDVRFDELQRRVYVTLPAPEILAVRLDELASHVISRRTDFFARRSEGLESTARRQALADLESAAVTDETAQRVRDSAEEQLRALVAPFGGSVVVKWRFTDVRLEGTTRPPGANADAPRLAAAAARASERAGNRRHR